MARKSSPKKLRKPSQETLNLDEHFATRVTPEISSAPWIMRITEYKGKPIPMMLIRQRIFPEDRDDADLLTTPRSILIQKGMLYGESQRRCLPIIRTILARIQDKAGIPLELNKYLLGQRITYRGNLPLNEEAGYKLALIFKLQERLKQLDKVELIARRVDRFTKEEAGYWYSRMTNFGSAANRWAAAGMKIMLGGPSGDPEVQDFLEKLRELY